MTSTMTTTVRKTVKLHVGDEVFYTPKSDSGVHRCKITRLWKDSIMYGPHQGQEIAMVTLMPWFNTELEFSVPISEKYLRPVAKKVTPQGRQEAIPNCKDCGTPFHGCSPCPTDETPQVEYHENVGYICNTCGRTFNHEAKALACTH